MPVLTGSILDQYNKMPCIPQDQPLGDAINEAADSGGSGGVSTEPVLATNTGVPLGTATPVEIAASAQFTTGEEKNIAVHFGPVLVGTFAAPGLVQFSVQLLDAVDTPVDSFSVTISSVPAGSVLLTPALSGAFPGVPAGTYSVKVFTTLPEALQSDGGNGYLLY